MTSFHVASFIGSSVRAILPKFSMTTTLVQKLACQLFKKFIVVEKNGKVKTFSSVRSTEKTCQSKLSQ